MSGATALLRRVADALVEQGARLALPARLAGTLEVAGPLRVLDALPLADGGLAVVQAGDELLAVPVAEGGRRRAEAGDGVAAALLAFLREGGAEGRFAAHRLGPCPEPGTERAIDVDQSNESIVVAERAVVKVFARTAPGPQPGVELPAHLVAVGFTAVPTPFGWVAWSPREGADAVLASVVAYLPGAEDGWTWCVRSLEDALEAGDERAGGELGEGLGRLVADLHRALATPSPIVPEPVGTAGRATVAGWRRRAEATLEEALALAEGEVGERLRALAPAARAALAALDAIDRTPTMRIHGDLHVGQILRWRDGVAIGDFDGNPLAPLAERAAPGPLARDVASMAMALDHVGRIVGRRRPTDDAAIEGWIRAARSGFLTAYRAALGEHARLLDERLLRPFEVAQECHEHVYAARYLPSWAAVPDRALAAILGGPT